MRWEKSGNRDLRLVQISPSEQESLKRLLESMVNKLPDAGTIAKRLKEDVLRRRCLENHRLNRTETLAQLSAWCDASGKHTGVRSIAQAVSRLLFAGRVVPRLVSKAGQPVSDAERLLDDFIADLLTAQDAPGLVPGDLPETEHENMERTEDSEVVPLPTTVSIEKDLRDHIAHNPSIIEPGLKLKGKEYSTDTGKIDVLCEDSSDRLVVIELKKDRSSDQVVGQILRYMGGLQKKENRDVRGIIILGKPDQRVVDAVYPVPNIKLMYYRVQFQVTEEPPGSDEMH